MQLALDIFYLIAAAGLILALAVVALLAIIFLIGEWIFREVDKAERKFMEDEVWGDGARPEDRRER